MSEKKNLPASIHQRLLNTAKQSGKSLTELLLYYAMERWLYRLSVSDYADKFVLKGALTLQVWEVTPRRVTRDIDMLMYQLGSEKQLLQMLKVIASQSVPDDGLTYYVESIKIDRITKQKGYPGFRARFQAGLSKPQLYLQLDIGIGDLIHPPPQKSKYPTLLKDFPAPELKIYSRESAIAEKFEAIVKLDEVNSRMKDYYDLWLLARQFDFDTNQLATAIQLTFNKRQTVVPERTEQVFTDRLIQVLAPQWKSYIQRNNLPLTTQDFRAVVYGISNLLAPALREIHSDTQS